MLVVGCAPLFLGTGVAAAGVDFLALMLNSPRAKIRLISNNVGSGVDWTGVARVLAALADPFLGVALLAEGGGLAGSSLTKSKLAVRAAARAAVFLKTLPVVCGGCMTARVLAAALDLVSRRGEGSSSLTKSKLGTKTGAAVRVCVARALALALVVFGGEGVLLELLGPAGVARALALVSLVLGGEGRLLELLGPELLDPVGAPDVVPRLLKLNSSWRNNSLSDGAISSISGSSSFGDPCGIDEVGASARAAVG